MREALTDWQRLRDWQALEKVPEFIIFNKGHVRWQLFTGYAVLLISKSSSQTSLTCLKRFYWYARGDG